MENTVALLHGLEEPSFLSLCVKQAAGTVLSTSFLHRPGAELLGTIWRLQNSSMTLSLFPCLSFHSQERDSHVCGTYPAVKMVDVESPPTPLAWDRAVSPSAQVPKQIFWADLIFPDLLAPSSFIHSHLTERQLDSEN